MYFDGDAVLERGQPGREFDDRVEIVAFEDVERSQGLASGAYGPLASERAVRGKANGGCESWRTEPVVGDHRRTVVGLFVQRRVCGVERGLVVVGEFVQ